MYLLWEFLGFHSGAVEVSALLACGATSLGDWRHRDLWQRHMPKAKETSTVSRIPVLLIIYIF